MAKQKVTKAKAASKAMKPEDGENGMGLSAEEMQDWMVVQEELVDQGYGPEDVQRELLRKHPSAKERAGSGLMASARTSLNKEVKWKHVVYLAVGVIGFIGLLKLIGMAFNINIPALHIATASDIDLDI